MSFATSCPMCRDSGFIQAVDRKNKSSFAFRCGACNSANNRGISASIPTWSNNFKNDFELYSNFMARGGWKPEQPKTTELTKTEEV